MRHLLEEVLPKNSSFQDFIVDQTFPQIGRRVLALNGRRLEGGAAQPGNILLAMEEVRRPGGKAEGKAEVFGTSNPNLRPYPLQPSLGSCDG